jgi:hypothetical protein
VTSGTAGAQASAARAEPLPVDADRDEIAAKWNEEAPDPSWSSTVQEYLTSTFSELQTDGRVLDVSCRTTVCRAVFEFASPSAASRFSEDIADPDFRKWISIRTLQPALEAEVFFGRDGARATAEVEEAPQSSDVN